MTQSQQLSQESKENSQKSLELQCSVRQVRNIQNAIQRPTQERIDAIARDRRTHGGSSTCVKGMDTWKLGVRLKPAQRIGENCDS